MHRQVAWHLLPLARGGWQSSCAARPFCSESRAAVFTSSQRAIDRCNGRLLWVPFFYYCLAVDRRWLVETVLPDAARSGNPQVCITYISHPIVVLCKRRLFSNRSLFCHVES